MGNPSVCAAVLCLLEKRQSQWYLFASISVSNEEKVSEFTQEI